MRAIVSFFAIFLASALLVLALAACTGETTSVPPADGDENQTDGDSEATDSDTTPQEDGDNESAPDGDADKEGPVVDGDQDSSWPDGDSEAEGENCLQTYVASPSLLSKITVGQTIEIDATQPGFDNSTLLFHYSLIIQPQTIDTLHLVCDTCDLRYGENLLQADTWTSQSKTRFYLPVAGMYRIGVDVQGPDSFCRGEITFETAYTEDLAIELVEEEQDYPQSNVDLLLVRERANATFAVPAAESDLYHPSPVAMPSCGKDAECYGGLFPCDTTLSMCKNQCSSDAACKAIDLGFVCQDQTCQPLSTLACTQDKECGLGLSCTPVLLDDKAQRVCTLHDADAQNDTCFLKNPNPVWGAYQPTEKRCQETQDCLTQDPQRLSLCNADPGNTNTCAVPIPDEQPQALSGGSRFPEVQRLMLARAPQGRLRGVVHQRQRSGGAKTSVSLMAYAKGRPLWPGPLRFTFASSDEIVWKAFDITIDTTATTLRTLCAGQMERECLSDRECQGALGNSAFRCENEHCNCPGSNPYVLFSSDPYANPFSLSAKSEGLPFVPQGATPRSIFCDSPTDQPAPDGPSCATLYNR